MSFIDKLTKEDILTKKIPLKEILENSFYYPSSGFDGNVIRIYSKEIQSFVYCDYGIEESHLIRYLNDFYGYKILANRKVELSEFNPEKWKVQLPPNITEEKYLRCSNFIKSPYAHWAVYEREDAFGEEHGAKRFSLLCICGEGVATYQALYWTNNLTAKAIGIIQCGAAFGGNWTNYKHSPFSWVINKNPYGIPDIIFYGGMGSGYEDLDWKNYEKIKSIKPYYHGPYGYKKNGECTIWAKKEKI